ncbi:PREDICTED: cardiomyopathy-associated protein 5 [Thamnophis sirtalis]|uniref:Cardiomyopathy-associated protein 5 n=1 Tax=Thamnophis sirtalis TaxID=35019 RepID=A0A6I9XR48_9SAUR|nr:PREDICTED: cardiomyopathy-associated protein 5 [Thamnophis sirtalis]
MMVETDREFGILRITEIQVTLIGSMVHQTPSSFKKHSQNEEMKSKLSDAMEAVQSEESSLTWETNSSRCSTSHASEASITSGVYSMENSYPDCSPGKVTFLKEERKTTQEKPSNSTHQTLNETTEPDSQECDFCQTPVLKKAEESEFDPSDPQSWPSQVQPSKIKDYLVQITQEVTSGPEEKENTLMRKGELPIKGTVRARILQITAVLEERHKKVFRRINNKDMPPPSEVIRKPREPPKVFSRRGISVSLRHIEPNATEKNNKKEVLSYNLRHVETKSSKSALYSKEERKPQHLFLPKTQQKPLEKTPKISTHLDDKAKRQDVKQYSPAIHPSLQELIQPAESDKMEEKEKRSVSPDSSNTALEKSFNFVGEKKEVQDHTPMIFEDSDLLKEVRSRSENQVTQPCSPVPVEPLPYVESEIENQSDSFRTLLSETSIQQVQHHHNIAATPCEPESCNFTDVRTQSMESTIPSRLEIKDASLVQSVEEAEKHSTEIADANPEMAKLPSLVRKKEKQEKEQLSKKSSDEEMMPKQCTVLLQTKSDQLPLSLVQEPETQETESASELLVMNAEPEVIDFAEIRNQTMDSTIPSGMEVSGTSLEFSVEEADKQEVPLDSTGTKDTILEKARLPSSIKEEKKQEEEQLAEQYSEKEQLEDKATIPFETKLNQPPLFGYLDHKSEAHETELATHLAARHGESVTSDFAEVRNQAMDSAIPSEMEVSGTSLEFSVEEADKQEVPLDSTGTKDTILEKARLPSSVKEGEKQEELLAEQYSEKEQLEDKATIPFETKLNQPPLFGYLDHKSEAHETELATHLAARHGESVTSDFAEVRNQAMDSAIPSEMEVSGRPFEHSVKEADNEATTLYSTETKDEKARLPSSVKEREKQEEEEHPAEQCSEEERLQDKLTAPFETKPGQLLLLGCQDHNAEDHATEPVSDLAAVGEEPEVSEILDIRNQAMEFNISSQMEVEDEPLEPSAGEAEKQEVPPYSTKTKHAVSEKARLPSSVKEGENQEEHLTAQYSGKEQLQDKATTPFETKLNQLPLFGCLDHKSEAHETEPATHLAAPEVSDFAEIRNQTMESTIPLQMEITEQLPVFECLEHTSKVHESEPIFDGESDVCDLAEIRNQTMESAIPSEMEVSATPLEHSVGETKQPAVPLYLPETKEAIPEKARFSYPVREGGEQEIEQLSDKTKVEDQFTLLSQRKSGYLPLVHKSDGEETELEPDLASRTQEIHNTVEEPIGLSESSYTTAKEEAAEEEKLKSDLPRQAAQTQPSLTTVSEGKHVRDKTETLLASTESLGPDSTLSVTNAQEEKAQQHSTAPAQSEPEHFVISKSIKAPHEPEEILLFSDKVTEPVSSSEQLLSTPSFLIASVEMHGTEPPSLKGTAPLFEQPDSNIPCLPQQMKKQSNWSDSTELTSGIAEVSFSTGSFQNAETTKEENLSLSSTEGLAKELASNSRETEIDIGTKTGQLSPTVSVQHPGEAPVQMQELNSENQLHPTINAQSDVEKQAKPSCETSEDQPKQPLESESREHFIQQNSTVSSLLEGTTALHSVNEMHKEIMQPDKPIIKPLQLDSLYPGFEPPQTDDVQQQTLWHLSQTLLPVEVDTMQLGEKKEINGTQPPLPQTRQALSQSVYLTDVQENQGISGTAAKDPEFLSMQLNKADTEHYGTVDPESKHLAKHPVELITAQSETPSTTEMPELGKHLDASIPISSAEGEGLQMPVSVTADSEDEQPISSKNDREEMECSAPIIPTSKLKGSASETQGNQNDLSKTLNEASESPPLILSFVPDKIKPQAILTKSVVSSLPASQQSTAVSSELMDQIEIGKNNFSVPEFQDLPLLTTSSVEEVSKEPLHSSMATKTVSEESRSLLDDATSEEISEQPPVSAARSAEYVFVEPISSCSVPEKEKQVQPHSAFNKEPMDAVVRKSNVEETQFHLLVTQHSETESQDSKLYSPVVLQSELEGLTSLNSTEEKPKQETALYSPPILPQGILYCHEEKEDQKRRTSETECSKDQDAPLKDDNLLQPVKESQLEEIQLYCSATLEDSSQLADMKPQEQEDYLPKTEEIDSGVSVLSQLMDDAKKQEMQITRSEATQIEGKPFVLLENEMKLDLHPPFTASLDTKQLDFSYSKQPELYSFEEQNQTSEQEPHISSLFTKKVKEPEENLYPSLVSTSLLSPSNSATLDPEKKQETQTCTTEITKEMPEEPMSIAAFLLSEAKTIETFSPQISEKENLETQAPFGDADSINGSTALSDKNAVAERNTEFSPRHFESEPQVDRVISSTEHLSKAEETKQLPTMEDTLKVPENSLSKEKEFKDQQKFREEALPAPNLDQRKDIVNISESGEVVKTNVPLISSVDRKKLIPEAVETISLLETKACNDTRDVVVDKEPSVYKPNKQYTVELKVDHHETTENESKEIEKGKSIKESREMEEVSVIPGSKDDNVFNNANIDYVRKDTLIENTSFTQIEKEKSIQDTERPFDDIDKQYVEVAYPAAKSKNIVELSLLERQLNKAPNGLIEKQNATATHQDISKTANENKTIEAVRDDDKSREHELNLANINAVLFNTEKDELSQTPAASLPITVIESEVLEMPPALAFLCKDFYEEEAGDSEKDNHKCKEVKDIDLSFHIRDHIPDDGIETHLEKEIPRDYTPNNVEESKNEDILNGQSFKEETVTQPKVAEDTYEPNGKKNESADMQPGLSAQVEECVSDTLTNGVTEVVSDIKIRICQETHAIPFGREFYSSGASNDDSSQRREEESLSDDTGQQVPEETSDEECSPILDYAATLYQTESAGQDGSSNDAGYAIIQNQQSEIKEVHGMDEGELVKIAGKNAQSLEGLGQAERQEERQLEDTYVLVEPPMQDTKVLDHKDLPCLDTEVQKLESGIGENSAQHLMQYDTPDQLAAGVKSDKQIGEVDYSLLSHDFDTYPLYSIKEEEDSDIDEDLAELLNYEVITHDDVFQEEISSEIAHEELLFDDKDSLDGISDTYEFVNEGEAKMYAEEKTTESLDLEMLQRKVPEYEFLQKEVDQAHLDTYCYQCKCPISSEDKLFEEHKDHKVADLGTAVTVLKGQLNGFLDVLQQRSLKIEGCVSEIEALFNTLEDNCKEKEKLLEEQNENVVKMVFGHHERKSQNFEEAKNTKMEYLYEQMVIFQDYIDTAKETLEMIIKETEEIDDFDFLKSSEEINKRLLSTVENIVTLEKMPAAFSQFEPCAGGFTNNDRTLQLMPVPHTPKLQPQDPNSATSTSIAVYWTLNEDNFADFFQVYCMEESPGSKDQSGFVEEYRVIVKESNCILEDLEPGHCYSVWVMAVNYAGCSFPSDKSIFRTVFIAFGEILARKKLELSKWRTLAGIRQPEIKVHLQSNLNYFFYLRAVNTFGISEQSEAALISTKGTRFHIMRELVHPALQVSPNGTMISLPDDANLTGSPPVLGELLPAQGWHYWEITVSDCGAYKVGICSSTLLESSDLGQKNNSWCLHCSNKTRLTFLHNGEISEIMVTEQPVRIGILLDYSTGRLLFLNAERGQLLSAIKYRFTKAAYPVFVLEQSGFLNLHTGMEVPEFAKQS